jgi:tetratricopeptide (TPR) repeat protein
MALGGTLFFQANGQVPMTLPSHASLLTSTYPFALGVEENGETVPPGVVTLAAVLKSRGYRTGAFVGAFVLDRRFGLNQGFDAYDSPFNLHLGQGEDPITVRRPGGEVIHAALQWLEQNANQPFFLFLHLFDLHMPYPASAGSSRRSGYAAQLDYVDRVLGGFWQYLRSKGLLDKSLIVFTSDHGESLGEHGEPTHGYFIYQSTLWVPLIFHWPAGSPSYPSKIDEPVRLLDVGPTILQFLGLAPPPQFQGRSLLEFFTRDQHQAREVYSETLYPRDHLHCSPLRCLRLGRYKYIEAPKPELYDLSEDPVESHNIYSRQSALVLTLRDRLLSLRAHYLASVQSNQKALSPEVLAGLAALGYVAVAEPNEGSREAGPDPKDRLEEYHHYDRAIMLAQTGRFAEGVDEFQKILKEDPQNVLAHYYLAVSYFYLRRLDEAAGELEATLALAPCFTRADELLGTIGIEKKDYGSARAHLEHLLTFAPEDFGAHYNLGMLAELDGRWEDALRHLRAAVEADPESAQAHNELGSVYFDHQQIDQARREFAQAVHLNPKSARAHYNLGIVLLKLQRVEDAASEFRQAIAADPQDQEARRALKMITGPGAQIGRPR